MIREFQLNKRWGLSDVFPLHVALVLHVRPFRRTERHASNVAGSRPPKRVPGYLFTLLTIRQTKRPGSLYSFDEPCCLSNPKASTLRGCPRVGWGYAIPADAPAFGRRSRPPADGSVGDRNCLGLGP